MRIHEQLPNQLIAQREPTHNVVVLHCNAFQRTSVCRSNFYQHSDYQPSMIYDALLQLDIITMYCYLGHPIFIVKIDPTYCM